MRFLAMEYFRYPFHLISICELSLPSLVLLPQIWDIRSHRLLQHYVAHGGPVQRLAFHPSGHLMITASQDATLKV